jgi:hypothetical protein
MKTCVHCTGNGRVLPYTIGRNTAHVWLCDDCARGEPQAVTVLEMSPALPCGNQKDASGAICGNLSPFAIARPNAEKHGQWVLRPVCEQCANKATDFFALVDSEGDE